MFGISLTAGILMHSALFLLCVHHLVSGYFFHPSASRSPEGGAAGDAWSKTLADWLTPFLFTASLLSMVAALSSGELWRDVPTDLFFFGMFGLLGWLVLGVWAGRVASSRSAEEGEPGRGSGLLRAHTNRGSRTVGRWPIRPSMAMTALERPPR